MTRRSSLKRLLQAAACSWLAPRWGTAHVPGTTSLYYPSYVDVAEKAGLTAKTIISGHQNKDFLLSTTGGGVALFDYDNDGWPDIFIVGGPIYPPRGAFAPETGSRILLRNLGRLERAQKALSRYAELTRSRNEKVTRSRLAVRQFVVAESEPKPAPSIRPAK